VTLPHTREQYGDANRARRSCERFCDPCESCNTWHDFAIQKYDQIWINVRDVTHVDLAPPATAFGTITKIERTQPSQLPK
jgi:hypothetical protein